LNIAMRLVSGAVTAAILTIVVAAFLLSRTAQPPGPPTLAAGAPDAAPAVTARPAQDSTGKSTEAPGEEPSEPPVESDECLLRHGIFEYPTRSLENLQLMAPTSFVGRIREVSPARWSTEDGAQPKDEKAVLAAGVYRLAEVDVTNAMSGELSGTETVSLRGGRIGCSEFWVEGFPMHVKPGDEFLFFIAELTDDPTQYVKEGALFTHTMWPVVDGRIQTEADGLLSVDTLVQRVAALSR